MNLKDLTDAHEMNLKDLTDAQLVDLHKRSLKLVAMFLCVNQMSAEQAGETDVAATYKVAGDALCDAYPGLAQAVRDDFLKQGGGAHVH